MQGCGWEAVMGVAVPAGGGRECQARSEDLGMDVCAVGAGTMVSRMTS